MTSATNPPRIFTEGGSVESSEDAAYTARSDADRRKARITPGRSIVAPALRGDD